MQPKYPEVTVRLIGEDGNAFHVMSKVVRALREAGVSQKEVARYLKESTKSDYNHLLRTAARWVEVR